MNHKLMSSIFWIKLRHNLWSNDYRNFQCDETNKIKNSKFLKVP